MLSPRTLGHLSAVSAFLDTAPGMRGGQPADEQFTAGVQLPSLVPALLEEEGRLRVAATALTRGRDLRARLTQIWALAAVDAPTALTAVNTLLAEVGPLRVVEAEDGTAFAAAETPADAVERLTALAALALADTAVQGELARLRVCAGEDCENTLVDASRNRSKRFCDAANCANRTHVRSYRARLAGAAPAEAAESASSGKEPRNGKKAKKAAPGDKDRKKHKKKGKGKK
ncbi:CGNR zinc finger domain-containing protein [Micrococcus sp.]|uniref:CGNR zinc finger domain-containing protein n=1 Tax=Micrococcus sp. TaxID=1271 RepID=UPI002A91EAD8|nr:CGNR zinc finger domain-containing protein [Micrococcus sp.]MDY6055006.1 CGNR zinc finger domain-containing protein [Micrococcus sp.]